MLLACEGRDGPRSDSELVVCRAWRSAQRRHGDGSREDSDSDGPKGAGQVVREAG